MQAKLFDTLPTAIAPRSAARARLERKEARLQSLMRPGGRLKGVAHQVFCQNILVSPIYEGFNDPEFAKWFRALRRARLVRKVQLYEWCGVRTYWQATRTF